MRVVLGEVVGGGWWVVCMYLESWLCEVVGGGWWVPRGSGFREREWILRQQVGFGRQVYIGHF